jgi:hypothetical protein
MNSTERIFLQFSILDMDVAAAVAKASPPMGISVGKPVNVFKASTTGGGGPFVVVAIQFMGSIASGLLVRWLYDCFAKSGKKQATINNKKCVFNKRNIRCIIEIELKNQRDRKEQHQRDKKRPSQKRR